MKSINNIRKSDNVFEKIKGRQFDKNGNMRQWWTNQTVTEYINRTKCFVDQYENYYLPEVNDHVNKL